ncbi:hypothetical protein GF402_08880 [Candidatus Fermentibacteria bacterium]|nr:hypothetical protein [Candidatus Fermentibacteria bacterium]
MLCTSILVFLFLATDGEVHEITLTCVPTVGFYVASACPSGDGGLAVCGVTHQGVDYLNDAMASVITPRGSLDWDRTFSGVNSGWFNSVSTTTDGGLLLAGATDYSPIDEGDSWVVKVGPAGFVDWEYHREGDEGPSEAVWAYQRESGEYMAAGYTESVDGAEVHSWLARLNRRGEMESFQEIPWSGFKAYDGSPGPGGTYVLAGERMGIGAVCALDAEYGDIEWSDTFGRTSSFNRVILTADEHVVAAGALPDRSGDAAPLLCSYYPGGARGWTSDLEGYGARGTVAGITEFPAQGFVVVLSSAYEEVVLCDAGGSFVRFFPVAWGPSAAVRLEGNRMALVGGGSGKMYVAFYDDPFAEEL